MTGDFTVREARAEDAGAIADVHVQGWQWGYRELLPAEALARIDRAQRVAMWTSVLDGSFDGALVWVAERDGAVIGFAADGPSRDAGAPEDEGELYALYLREDAAAQGVGRALLEAAVNDLRERGAEIAVLWVLGSNARALTFYAKAGWTPDGATRSEPWEGVTLEEVRLRVKW
ncbi:MAG: GNAT family N-acetyltransferase [Deltaproteobacteria bacterium]